jgi:hypothetical protein
VRVSAATEVAAAALHERAQPFLNVVALHERLEIGEQAGRGRRLGVGERVARGCERRVDAERGLGRDPLRDRDRAAELLAGGADLLDEADAERLVRVEVVAATRMSVARSSSIPIV